MGFTAEQLAEIRQQKADNRIPVTPAGEPVDQQEPEEGRGFGSLLSESKQALSYGFGQGLAGTANVAQAMGATFMNRNIEVARALMNGDIVGALDKAAKTTAFVDPTMAINMLYRVVPAEFVNKIHPLQGVVPLPDGTWNKKAEEKFGKMPKTENSVAGALYSGLAAVGDSATMPVGGLFKEAGKKVASETTKQILKRFGAAGGRDASAAMGAGAGGHTGGEIGAGLVRQFDGDEDSQAIGRGIGGLGGGVAGGVLGATRPGLFWEGGKAGAGVIKTAYKKGKDTVTAAYETAKRIGEENRTQSLRDIFRAELDKLVPVDQQKVTKVLGDFISESAALDPNLRSAYQQAYGALKQQGLSDDEIQQTWRMSHLTGHEPTKELEGVGERLAPAKDIVKIQAAKRATEKRTAEVIDEAMDAPLKQNKDMERAYTRFVGKPYSGSLEAARNARRFFQQTEKIAKERAASVAAEMPPLDPNREFNLGEQVRTAQANMIRYGEDGGLWGMKQAKYKEAGDELAKQEANVEPLTKLLKEKAELIGERTTKTRVPLQAREAAAPKGEETIIESLAKIDPLFGNQVKVLVEKSATRSATLQTIFEARKAVANRIKELDTNPLADSKKYLLQEVHATLDGMLKTQASGSALQKLADADKFYSEVYAPVARNGLPGKMVRRSRQLQAGEDLMPSSKVLSEFTRTPEGMRDFQRLADGKLTGQRLDGMYQALEAHTRGSLGEKIKNGAIDYDTYNVWKRNNAHVLEAIPEEAARIEQRVAKMIQANEHAERNARRAEFLFGGPVSSTVGVDRAKEMLSAALADEKKMAFLVTLTKNKALKEGDKSKGLVPLWKEISAMISPYSGGHYDAEKAAQAFKAAEPGLMVLATEVLGSRAAATKHLTTIRELMEIQTRVGASAGLIPPLSLGKMEDPLSGVGLTVPQATSYLRAQAINITSPLYTAVLLGTKAINARMKLAVNKAMEDLVMNPKKANAMLKLHVETNAGRLPDKEVIDVALGVGSYDRLMDGAKTIGARTKAALATDEIGVQILRGALIGPGGAFREGE